MRGRSTAGDRPTLYYMTESLPYLNWVRERPSRYASLFYQQDAQRQAAVYAAQLEARRTIEAPTVAQPVQLYQPSRLLTDSQAQLEMIGAGDNNAIPDEHQGPLDNDQANMSSSSSSTSNKENIDPGVVDTGAGGAHGQYGIGVIRNGGPLRTTAVADIGHNIQPDYFPTPSPYTGSPAYPGGYPQEYQDDYSHAFHGGRAGTTPHVQAPHSPFYQHQPVSPGQFEQWANAPQLYTDPYHTGMALAQPQSPAEPEPSYPWVRFHDRQRYVWGYGPPVYPNQAGDANVPARPPPTVVATPAPYPMQTPHAADFRLGSPFGTPPMHHTQPHETGARQHGHNNLVRMTAGRPHAMPVRMSPANDTPQQQSVRIGQETFRDSPRESGGLLGPRTPQHRVAGVSFPHPAVSAQGHEPSPFFTVPQPDRGESRNLHGGQDNGVYRGYQNM